MKWTSVSKREAVEHWDRNLMDFPGHALVQSFGWGDYKAAQGWTPMRWMATGSNGRPLAMAQMLCRSYPARTAIVWCPGGLVGPIEYWSSDLLDQIVSTTGARNCYCRVAFTREKTDADAEWLRHQGWVPPSRPVSAPRTLIWDLTATDDELLAGLRPNWRHNLKRALNRRLRVVEWTHPSVEKLGHLFEAMAAFKDMRTYVDRSSLQDLLRTLDGRVVMYACENDAGTPVAIRACALQGDWAWDLLAAASPEGRRCYASYAVFWTLVRHCRRLGVKQYDLGGIDPVAAPGVYDFKRGTGARERECLGEWEWATSRLLARAVNLHVRLRPAAALA